VTHHRVQIRDATAEDAGVACEVIRQSIAQLCAADHHHDPLILERWLSNKRPDIVAGWAKQAGNSLLVAVDGDAVLAAGLVRDSGEITLNYVAPEARFQGISSALLAALEARAAARGNTRCMLTSTETAHRFYLSRGYVDDGAPRGHFGTSRGYPMSKPITAIA
jgi:GNAT superfamily N-acetyltransferase